MPSGYGIWEIKTLGGLVFNATLTSVSNILASACKVVFFLEEIIAVLNAYCLIVSTSTHPLSHGGVF